jgi:predicted nucleotidyltransferase component of viral defense system
MVERIQVTESFVRLKVTADAESTILDLAYDARLTDPTETDLGRTLSLEELAADKTLALFGRAAARDFIDVDTLTQRFRTRRRAVRRVAHEDHGLGALPGGLAGGFNRSTRRS